MWKKLVFSVVPLAAFLLIGEIAARLVRAPLHLESYRLLRIDQVRRGYPAARDPVLGYVPEAGYAVEDSRWGTTITVDEHGFRSNGAPRSDGVPVVAVGDSFTWGAEVSDDETWPAYLEQEIDAPVINAGVFGYSFTQSVLRAERVLRNQRARCLVLSFIPDDLLRNEFSKRYAPVPYFELADDELVLRNVPVAFDMTPEEVGARRFKNLLGHSALLDAILANTATGWWITNEKKVRVHPPGTGARLGLALVERIAEFCEDRGCGLLVVLQGIEPVPEAVAVLERAESCGAETLDLIASFRAEAEHEPDLRERYFDGHMTAAGNRWAAERIAEEMRQSR